MREIRDEELSERIRGATRHFAVWGKEFCSSLAGQHDKLPVRMADDRLFLTQGSAWSTHILKPQRESAIISSIVANEHFCMTLAKTLGLPVAPVSIRRVPEPILVVERFDRVVDGDVVRRRHMVDACQVLDMPPSFKYERNFGDDERFASVRDGVSFENLFTLGRGGTGESVEREKRFRHSHSARWQLVSWALFNFLAGNSDAHGKNLSFFVDSCGLTPAPAYDLLSVSVYGKAVEQRMAMAFGDQFDSAAVGARDMRVFARQAELTAPAVAVEMAMLGRAAMQHAPELAESPVYIDRERELVRKIAAHVLAKAQRLEAMADELMRVDA
ncbi:MULTISPECIES: HipA domain-containing protein [unclassified Caballeronia]|uniref:HipA domain-containing protein n=1 Tax=unclassified Caballeronia TaxID=2646786 RepID=UPI002027F9FA|nr:MULTISPECIES: HipA domain-containing protein [unclassified Caballeronia]MDR5770151.1 HipA domain-containing protein [Caballeronia sp. LZ028]